MNRPPEGPAPPDDPAPPDGPALDDGPVPVPSGLRNPSVAVRGAGAVALIVMAVVLLMAIVPLVTLGAPAAARWLAGALALLSIVLCGLLRHRWAWPAALLVPAALLAGGFLHGVLAVLGVLFGLMWAYMLHVRRTVLG